MKWNFIKKQDLLTRIEELEDKVKGIGNVYNMLLKQISDLENENKELEERIINQENRLGKFIIQGEEAKKIKASVENTKTILTEWLSPEEE